MALKKNKAMKKSKKGILLTLLTIVLFVLMLGELITYVVLNINYTNIASQASQSLNSGSFVSNLNGSISNFMHTSLNNALYSAIYYEGNPTLRKDYFINNTSFVLSTLMQNGTINGYNMSSRMGETMSKYIASLKNSASAQNIALNITNGSLRIYQNSAFAISASYTALASINQSGSVSTYPIYAHTSVSVAYKPDLLSVEEGMNTTLIPYSGYPKAQLIGNIYAKAGSISPFMFVYGTPSYVSGEPKCSGISSSVENANYILVTPDAADINQSVCNMGGLITNITNTTTPLKPYLLYTNATVINDTRNYTHILLNGPGLASYSLSALKNAITNGYYFATNYTSDYLGQAQGSVNQVSNYGSASFNLLNRKVANFDGISSLINIPTNDFPVGADVPFTLMAWIYQNNTSSRHYIVGYGGSTSNSQVMMSTNEFSPGQFSLETCGDGWTSSAVLAKDKWYLLAISYNGTGEPNFYVNGIKYGISSTWGTPQIDPQANGGEIGNGGTCNSGTYMHGNIASTAVYNSSLSPSQISKIYAEGISSMPISNAGLVGWYPLDGNANDYSGNGNNGVPTNVIYSGLSNYTYNMLSSASIYSINRNVANFNLTKSSWVYSHAVILPNGTNTATITAWIKPKIIQGDGTYAGIVRIDGAGTGADGLLLSLQGSSGLPSMATWSNDFVPSSGPKVDYNTWNFVAVRINGTDKALLYVNGQAESGTLSSSLVPSLKSGGYSTNFTIGSTDSPGRLFNGSITNVQVYNAPLNISQLQQMYKSGMNAGPINNTNLVAWYPLDGNANDYSGNGNNGVPTAVSFNSLSNNPTSNLVEGVLNCANINACSNSTLQKLYLNPLPLAYAGKGFMNETTSLGLPFGGISDVASFNGQSGSSVVANTGSLLLSSDTATMAVWINWNSGQHFTGSCCGFRQEVLGADSSSNNEVNPIIAVNDSGTNEAETWVCTSNGCWPEAQSPANAIQKNKWYFLVSRYNGTDLSLWINSKQVAETAASGNLLAQGSGNYAYIGSRGNGGSFFNGSIADAQIYNIALSSAQIHDLYLNNTVSGATPVAYWPLSTGLNGLLNQTPDVINGNTGYLYSGSGQCTVAEVADGTCGVEYAQP